METRCYVTQPGLLLGQRSLHATFGWDAKRWNQSCSQHMPVARPPPCLDLCVTGEILYSMTVTCLLLDSCPMLHRECRVGFSLTGKGSSAEMQKVASVLTAGDILSQIWNFETLRIIWSPKRQKRANFFAFCSSDLATHHADDGVRDLFTIGKL